MHEWRAMMSDHAIPAEPLSFGLHENGTILGPGDPEHAGQTQLWRCQGSQEGAAARESAGALLPIFSLEISMPRNFYF
jgi:hypothetical protein